MDPAELLPMYDDSNGSMMTLGEDDRRLDLADAVPVMDSRASMRFLRCFTSSPVRNNYVFMSGSVFYFIFFCFVFEGCLVLSR